MRWSSPLCLLTSLDFLLCERKGRMAAAVAAHKRKRKEEQKREGRMTFDWVN
jgi:hypothetical protein